MDDTLLPLRDAAQRTITQFKCMSYEDQVATGGSSAFHETHRAVMDIQERMDTCEFYWTDACRNKGVWQYKPLVKEAQMLAKTLQEAAQNGHNILYGQSPENTRACAELLEVKMALEVVEKLQTTLLGTLPD